MPGMLKAVKHGSKTKTRTNDTSNTSKVPVKPSEEDEESDSDNGGIDGEGMERLMKALGDDGLDDFDQAQLDLALGDEDDWSTDDEGEGDDEASEETVEGEAFSGEGMDDSQEEESDKDEEGDGDGDGEGDDEEDEFKGISDGAVEQNDIALDDVESVDEDAVPRQKIEIDNEVRVFLPMCP
jgi:rRNA-processing protein EBP2